MPIILSRWHFASFFYQRLFTIGMTAGNVSTDLRASLTKASVLSTIEATLSLLSFTFFIFSGRLVSSLIFLVALDFNCSNELDTLSLISSSGFETDPKLNSSEDTGKNRATVYKKVLLFIFEKIAVD